MLYLAPKPVGFLRDVIQNWIVANRLASGIAYREGMDFFDGCSPAEISELARRYMKSDLANRAIVAKVCLRALNGR